MTSDNILRIIEQLPLVEENRLRDGTSYLAKWKDPRRLGYDDFIVLTNSFGQKVGGILNMGSSDIHMVVHPDYRGQHFMSNFLRSGILHEVWPECCYASIISEDICSSNDYYIRIHLLDLAGLEIINMDDVLLGIDVWKDVEENEIRIARGDYD